MKQEDILKNFAATEWDTIFTDDIQQEAIQSLERGKILFFPHLFFLLSKEEKRFLSPHCANPRKKNISYLPEKDILRGTHHLSKQDFADLKNMMERFYHHAHQLICALFPHYTSTLQIGRTSFRPIEVSDRNSSYRKDDKWLHVDAFPSSPNQGNRILRLFCNVNMHDEPRLWRVGEPFEKMARHFLPKLTRFYAIKSYFLKLFNVTKSYRTAYDHFMLQLHDKMKADGDYQKNAEQIEIPFPANTTWIVQTDEISHAAMKGQHVLEQTFYLPVEAMQTPELSPFRVLERMLKL